MAIFWVVIAEKIILLACPALGGPNAHGLGVQAADDHRRQVEVVAQYSTRIDPASRGHCRDLRHQRFAALQRVEQINETLANRTVAAVHSWNLVSGVVGNCPFLSTKPDGEARAASLEGVSVVVCFSELSGRQLIA